MGYTDCLSARPNICDSCMNGNGGGEGDDDLKMDGAAGCIPAEAMVQLRGLLSEKEWIAVKLKGFFFCGLEKLSKY